jgi:outer membrane protein, heavy metal efflux system
LLLLSPEMGAAQADYQRAQAVLHRQCVEPLPDVDVQSILFQHDNGTNGYNSSFQVSLPLPIRNRNQGAISEARMQLTAAHHAQHKVALNLQERLASAWQRYQSSLAEVKGFSAGDGILVNSRKTLELIRKAYDAGEIGSLELITAQRTYSQTSLQYLDALQEYWSARIELEGQLLKDSLQN